MNSRRAAPGRIAGLAVVALGLLAAEPAVRADEAVGGVGGFVEVGPADRLPDPSGYRHLPGLRPSSTTDGAATEPVVAPVVAADEQTAAPPPEPVAMAPAPAVAVVAPALVSAADLPGPPVAAIPSLTAADLLPTALEARLADAKSGWLPRLPRRDREALGAFYAARHYVPLFTQDGAWTAAARSVVAQLGRAGEDGLDPADYPVPTIGAAPSGRATSDLADAELKLGQAAILYARDARGGRIDPVRLSALITPKLDLPAGEAVLRRLVEAPDAGEALALYQPVYPGYRALRQKLADVRQNLSPGALVRSPGSPGFTIAALDDMPVARPAMSAARLEGDILANMERWRWLPAEEADRYVSVNVPEFRLRLIENGRAVHETRVITGKPDTPTPIFSGVMEYAIVNPSWHVPPSILKKEFLPRMAADPTYAERLGYEVVRRGNQISIRQPPGERNALGFIKFMFPNNHAVYLHDTPSRSLFGSARRAFSHGCVRVENPFRLADFVLGSEWSERRLRGLIGRGERTIFLPRKLPVHLTYFTVGVDETGELRSFEDIYGYNRRVRAALGLPG